MLLKRWRRKGERERERMEERGLCTLIKSAAKEVAN